MHLSSEGTTTATGVFAAQLRSAGARIQAGGAETAAGNMLKQRGLPNATGTFNADTPVGLVSQYSVGSKFSAPGSLNVRVMESGLRVLPAAGDFLMGPIGNTKLKDSDPTPCYSGRQVEDLTLDFPANRNLVRLPQDADVKTANLHYASHWSVNGQTLSVHREFTSNIDQPLCSGDIRKETMAALARIRDDYGSPVSFVVKSGFVPVTASFLPSDKFDVSRRCAHHAKRSGNVRCRSAYRLANAQPGQDAERGFCCPGVRISLTQGQRIDDAFRYHQHVVARAESSHSRREDHVFPGATTARRHLYTTV